MLKSVLSVLLLLVVAGCGGGDGRDRGFHRQVTTQILTDSAFDGYITQAPLPGVFTVSQGATQSVFAGIDPVTGAEQRAFLDFPLTGFGGVPLDAVIDSAFLDIVVASIQPQPLIGALPIRLDLVSFEPPTLRGTDFSRSIQPALVTTTIIPPISQADFGRHISIDVTSFMNEAQRLGLSNLQIRILLDSSSGTPAIIEINDTTGANRGVLAPLLQVTYF
jgi:hypothetical protein